MIFFEYMGIVNMADAILGRKEVENPDWYDMENEKWDEKVFPAYSIDRKVFGRQTKVNRFHVLPSC
jgi:hypothetical protein